MSIKSEHVVKLFTPTILDDCDFEVYKPEFERVFSSEKATNIAVSGPFGAGKTSVMATWEASKEGSEGHNYLHLSLANFKGIEKFGCDEDDSGEDRGAIEKMLLNQLVHKVDFWRVPKSRFKTTVVGKLGIAIPVIVAVVVALLLTLGFAEFDWYRARMAEGGRGELSWPFCSLALTHCGPHLGLCCSLPVQGPGQKDKPWRKRGGALRREELHFQPLYGRHHLSPRLFWLRRGRD